MGMWLKTKDLANNVSDTIMDKVEKWKKHGVVPTIATILVDGDPASDYYAKAKQKLAKKLGIRFHLITFANNVEEQALLDEIEKLNNDQSIHGIMLELPVPKQVNGRKLSEAILPEKDVDGISTTNKLACFTGSEGLYPVTPLSCIRILEDFRFEIKGKNVVLVGCGETVGKPLIQLLLRKHATLTICHLHTKDLSEHITNADILIVAAGCKGLIQPHMVHPQLVVIDAGITQLDDGICGDVDRDVIDYVHALTPVPGGVGTLTTVLLFENLMKAIDIQLQK